MTNFTLYAGTHSDPSEGACLVEAAILGFTGYWVEVVGVGSAPECFSKPLCAYGIKINDSMPDDIRTDMLAPFVEMLPGSAAPLEVELKRAEILVWCAIRHSVPFDLRALGDHERAEMVGKAATLEEAAEALKAEALKFTGMSSIAAMATLYAINVLLSKRITIDDAEWTCRRAADAATHASLNVTEECPVFDWAPCVQAFRDAFAVGE